MDKAWFERKKQYGAAAAIARQLFYRKLITPAEHQKLMAVLAQKYQPAANSSPVLSRNVAKKGV